MMDGSSGGGDKMRKSRKSSTSHTQGKSVATYERLGRRKLCLAVPPKLKEDVVNYWAVSGWQLVLFLSCQTTAEDRRIL
jgi:hypothetical protein